MTTDRIKAMEAARHADRIAIRTYRDLPEGSKVRDWDQCLLVKVGPDAWQVEPDSGEGPTEGPKVTYLRTSEVLVTAYGPITLAELPVAETDLQEVARRAAAAEYSRRFTLCQTTRGQAYTDAIAAAVLSALTPYMNVEAPK